MAHIQFEMVLFIHYGRFGFLTEPVFDQPHIRIRVWYSELVRKPHLPGSVHIF